ncbi:sce7725 family protein, partial [Flexivirga caeni]
PNHEKYCEHAEPDIRTTPAAEANQLLADLGLKHFCSESNETQDDPAGKFFEALEKLIDFVDERSLPTNLGIDGFRDLYQRQHFPGLGKVKELSIMNHMLVMQDAII